ncbi:MAG: hypothetical protein JWR51_233 [Devosia sp.]|uniref:XRE family transcriptional regulator n=1 Tax=Devosia sp. TaxID=1871048 RepID=UPI002607C33E|nr:XRE family transcriptional regulator [Devosia sp.]MDB5527130.1 hypothetical protein [Devosia sp.]
MNSEGEHTANFSANLRYLCEQHGAISTICRNININRQQFNKYLSGLHLPSPQNQRMIANFFGMSPAILFSEPDDFRMFFEGNYFHAIESLRNSRRMGDFLETVLFEAKSSDDALLGTYDRYHYSSIYSGKILKSAFCIYRHKDFLQHYYVERFPSYDSPGRTEYVFKYHGFTMPVAGRIFCVDFESLQKNELTFGIFAPVQRSSKNFMFGITSGIAASMFRQPFSARVALHYRGPGLTGREHLKEIGVLERTDPSIPKEVLQFLEKEGDLVRSA